jgi:hypothetical protein
MIPPALKLIKTIDQTELIVHSSELRKTFIYVFFVFVAVFLVQAIVACVICGAIGNKVSA